MLKGIAGSGERILAQKNAKAVCPHCKGVLTPKCGSIKVHHWAHKEAKGCPYAYGMTKWHYDWLLDYESLSEQGWEVEYFFNSIRFDAYNPTANQAIEFQRTIDLDYISQKVEICRQAGIKLYWLINPAVFRNFAYTDTFEDDKCDILFSPRRCKRKIVILLEKYINSNGVTFLIDFRDDECLPRYDSDGFRRFSGNWHRECFKNDIHPMKPGIYTIYEMPFVGDSYLRTKCVLKLQYHESRYNFY